MSISYFYLVFQCLKESERIIKNIIIFFFGPNIASYRCPGFHYLPCFLLFSFYLSFLFPAIFLCFTAFCYFFSKFKFSIVSRQHFVQKNVRCDDESIHFCAISMRNIVCMFGYYFQTIYYFRYLESIL